MAAGSWGNNGETPVYFSAYSRYWLGWDQAITVKMMYKPVIRTSF
ncbi:MAG: hypothetical protein CM15mP42_04470 [Methanobacteriota archaeon]|nr:MAG: hypothetical protein CM15mP42_04470 [Euryarchaeota archaeon]